MARARLIFRCAECGGSEPRWGGRCNSCGAWNSLHEEVEAPGERAVRAAVLAGGLAAPSAPIQIGDIDPLSAQPRLTGVAELDRVLDGGLVPGSVTLLGGEPGVGKSTLTMQLSASWPGRVLYVSAEESAQQVRLRADRLHAIRPDLWLLAESSIPHIVHSIAELKPDLVIVDSIQTIVDPELGSAPGSVVQVRECAHRLVQEAKTRGITVILVGHVTKEGTLAGPRVLEHVVDTVLTFEGDRHHGLRLLRSTKHRFGSTSELGVFEMSSEGLATVTDPSQLFLADRRTGVSGSVIVPTLDGHRPLVVELQALVVGTPLAQPRRSAQGFDQSRLNVLLAVLERRAKYAFGKLDVYASVVGGVRLSDPGADLAVCLAAVSAMSNKPLADSLVVCGEVGLGGELRQVAQLPRRLAEAARMGFTQAIVPESSTCEVPGLVMHRVPTLSAAVRVAFATENELATV